MPLTDTERRSSPNRGDLEDVKNRAGDRNEALGAQKVEVVGGSIVGGTGGTAQTDKSGFTEGSGSLTPIGGVVNDTPAADPAEDQAAVARITPKRALHVNLRKNDGTEVSPATEGTLAGIKTGTDKIPASPAQDRTAADASASTRLSDGVAFYKATTPADTQPVSAATLPLPAGASTEATLALVKAKTDNLDLAISALRDALRGASNKTLTDVVAALASVPVTGTFWQATQPVSAATLESHAAPATTSKAAIVDLGTARTNLGLFAHMGISVPTYRWIKLVVYGGNNATFSGTDVTNNFLSFSASPGTDGSLKIPINKLTKPDSDPFWEGRSSGEVYLTSQLVAGAFLVAVFGVV